MATDPFQPTGLHLDARQATLERILQQMGRVVVAFSGGVDSSFLLRVAVDCLGNSSVLAVTVSSPVHPEWERCEAEELARKLDVPHLILPSDELDIEEFLANSPDRCYVCKFNRFGRLVEIARERGFVEVVDGSNVDDLGDRRPGQRAAKERGVRSPLTEAGLTKADIRALSRQLGLPTWDRPSQACLASRFPYGERLTEAGLSAVGQAEEYLRGLGLVQVRVRSHAGSARIEAEPQDFAVILSRRTEIYASLQGLGFPYVSLDLLGFRSGSMNEVL
jgi:pyridinium-3,5-biscarboxylic acid mononucleotide sulfurtransferase